MARSLQSRAGGASGDHLFALVGNGTNTVLRDTLGQATKQGLGLFKQGTVILYATKEFLFVCLTISVIQFASDLIKHTCPPNRIFTDNIIVFFMLDKIAENDHFFIENILESKGNIFIFEFRMVGQVRKDFITALLESTRFSQGLCVSTE